MKMLITKIALTAGLFLLFITAFGQRPLQEGDKNVIYLEGRLLDTTKATPEQMVKVHRHNKSKALSKDHYYYEYYAGNLGVRFVSIDKSKNEIYEGLDSWGNENYKTELIDGNCAVEFAAMDVTEKNAAAYRYHVVLNNEKEIVTWTKPTIFKYTTDGKYKYAYLGKFNYAPGQVLKIEIYNIYNYRHMDGYMIDWRKVERPNVEGLIQYYLTRFRPADNGLFSRALTDLQQTTEKYYHSKNGRILIENGKISGYERPRYPKDFIETTNKNNIRFRSDDSVQNLSFRVKNGGRSYNYKVSLKRETAGFKDSLNLAEVNDAYDINREFWKTPGKYKITFTPKIHRHGGQPIYLLRNLATSISFTVLAPLNQKHYIPLKTVISIILVLMLAAAINITLLRNRHKRKQTQQAQDKQIVALKLQSVRAQLNPHFIFNALAGIQNLINKNAIEDANRYLTRFARLTRNVLDDGNKEFISLEQELSLLNDYLQMEQARFNFKFRVNIDEKQIDQQVEVPAMLLQPFVENAIKHGVSHLKDGGLVTVNIMKQKNNLILAVQDNGKGFNPQKAEGVGINLCRDRIALLNSIHKDTHIELHINSDNKGTLVTIELKNWL